MKKHMRTVTESLYWAAEDCSKARIMALAAEDAMLNVMMTGTDAEVTAYAVYATCAKLRAMGPSGKRKL